MPGLVKPNGPFLLTARLPGVSALTATLQLSVFGTAIWKLWMPKARSAGKKKLTTELASPPVVSHGLVIARTMDTRVSAFEASSGELQWTYQRSQPRFDGPFTHKNAGS